jgi:hypothetical protein
MQRKQSRNVKIAEIAGCGVLLLAATPMLLESLPASAVKKSAVKGKPTVKPAPPKAAPGEFALKPAAPRPIPAATTPTIAGGPVASTAKPIAESDRDGKGEKNDKDDDKALEKCKPGEESRFAVDSDVWDRMTKAERRRVRDACEFTPPSTTQAPVDPPASTLPPAPTEATIATSAPTTAPATTQPPVTEAPTTAAPTTAAPTTAAPTTAAPTTAAPTTAAPTTAAPTTAAPTTAAPTTKAPVTTAPPTTATPTTVPPTTAPPTTVAPTTTTAAPITTTTTKAPAGPLSVTQTFVTRAIVVEQTNKGFTAAESTITNTQSVDQAVTVVVAVTSAGKYGNYLTASDSTGLNSYIGDASTWSCNITGKAPSYYRPGAPLPGVVASFTCTGTVKANSSEVVTFSRGSLAAGVAGTPYSIVTTVSATGLSSVSATGAGTWG